MNRTPPTLDRAHRPLLSLLLLALFSAGISQCPETDSDGDGWTVEDDCDDEDANTYPGADELCDDADNDCDGETDEGLYSTWYPDQDSDAYGSDAGSVYECEQPEGYVELSGDCDDEDPLTYPHATEICDSADNDCDDITDQDSELVWYMDRDGDGFGTSDETAQRCPTEPGFLRVRGDCDDEDISIYPGATDPEGDGIDQDCGGKDGQQPSVGLDASAFTLLQEALDDAGEGDVVWVGPGEYARDSYINFPTTSLSLRSTHLADLTLLYKAMVVSDGQDSDTQIDGFTIAGNTWCGLFIRNSSPTIRNMIVRENGSGYSNEYDYYPSSSGGGMDFENSTSKITDTEITDNYVAAVDDESAGEALGGGIYAVDSSLTLERCRILRNRAYGWQYSTTHRPEDGLGGGLYLESSTSGDLTLIRDSVIADNEVGGAGGGIFAWENLRIENSVISGNQTIDSGGGVWCESCSIANSRILNNSANKSVGGVYASYSLTIQSSIISGNAASSGAGIYDNSNCVNIVDSVIASNNADEFGGSISFYDTHMNTCDEISISNSVIAYNKGGNFYVDPDMVAIPTLHYSDVYNPSDFGENYNFPEQDATNLEVEPAFLAYDEDGLPHDFHLSLSSPLIDVGDPSLSDPDGTRSDMGAFGGPDADLMDLDRDGYPNYFWPGTIDDAPAGFDPGDYDVDDLDWDVH